MDQILEYAFALPGESPTFGAETLFIEQVGTPDTTIGEYQEALDILQSRGDVFEVSTRRRGAPAEDT